MDSTAQPPPIPPSASATLASTPAPINRFRWWVHLLVIGGYPVIIALLALVMGHGSKPALSGGTRGLLMACGFQLTFFACLFGLGWLASRASREDLLLKWRPGWWVVPLGIAYSIALRLIMLILIVFVVLVLLATRVVTQQQIESYSKGHQRALDIMIDAHALQNDPLYYCLMITLVSFVMAGFTEELWRAGFLAALRKLWPRMFGPRIGEIVAVFLASIAFGIGHLPQGMVGVAQTTVLGFGLGLIMVLHRSIWPAVFAHGMVDATTFVYIAIVGKKLAELN